MLGVSMAGFCRNGRGGKWGSHFDPLDDIGDLKIGQFFFRRHHQRIVGLTDRFHHQAFVRFVDDDCGTALTTVQDRVARIQSKHAPLFFCTVTFLALFDKKWTDQRFKKTNLIRG